MFNVTSTYHGNLQPSFTGVITHILKAKNLDFSFLGGSKGTYTCCLVLRLDPISPLTSCCFSAELQYRSGSYLFDLHIFLVKRISGKDQKHTSTKSNKHVRTTKKKTNHPISLGYFPPFPSNENLSSHQDFTHIFWKSPFFKGSLNIPIPSPPKKKQPPVFNKNGGFGQGSKNTKSASPWGPSASVFGDGTWRHGTGDFFPPFLYKT